MSSTPAKTICRRCRLEYPGDALFCPNCGTARVQEDAADPMIGATVGERYMLLERMGQGGSGTIYRAEHITLRRKVAVKVLNHELSRDDLAIERFRREATTVGQLDNDHIVEIFDFGRTGDGRLYLAMELLEGDTLADAIEREGQLEIDRAVDVLIQLGETLMEAHAMGYIHRDLRPRNVFLANRRGKGVRPFVKLLDFGLAKLVEKEGEAASTSLGMTFGDPHYMSPEQARGDALDRRADIYSLGCIAYEMLIGEPPFVGGKVFDVLTRHVEETPVAPQERRSEVPAWLDHAVMRMLAKRPDERFITVYRVIEALRQGSDSGHIMSDEVARRPESVPPTSVSQAMARLGARAPAELAIEAPPEPPPATSAAGVVAVDAGEAEAEAALAAPAEPHVGTATALGLGVAPSGTAGGKRAQLALQSPARSAQSASNGSSGGLSAAWYADGEAMNREAASAQRRGGRARPNSPSDTGLVIQDEEYAETRRRPWRLPVIAGLAMLLGAAGALALSAARDDDDSSAETAVESRIAATPASQPAPAGAPAPQAASAVGRGEVVGGGAGEAASPGNGTASADEKAGADQKAADGKAAGENAASADEKASAGEKAASADEKAGAGEKAASANKQAAASKQAAKPPGRARASESPRSKLSRESGKARGRADGEPLGRFDHIGVEDASGPRAARSPPADRRPDAGGGDAAKADFYAKLGDRDLANGDFVGAASNFNKARGLDPQNANAILGLGEVALSQGSTAAALSHLRRAIKLVPRSARAHTLLGEALLASGRKQQAAGSFRRALKLEPDHSRAQDGLAETAK